MIKKTSRAVCFFNNKGGVGKTTLLCNVASFIASNHKLRIVVVDADPQCNATQLVLREADLNDLYSANAKEKRSSILDVLKPLSRGEPVIDNTINLCPGTQTRFTFDLLPGHPRLALLEDRLSQAWTIFNSGDFGGARQTNWCTQLLCHLKQHYDLIFIDVGPSLGALNRTVLIGTEYFVTPMGCDIFSIAGVENISAWLKDWEHRYIRAIEECEARGFSRKELASHNVRLDVEDSARFAGFTVQQYIAKSEAGKRRPTLQFERIRKKIPAAAKKSLTPFLAKHLTPSEMELGDVPNMYSLVPMAQTGHVPIHALGSNDGIVGAQYSQRENYSKFIEALAHSFLRNIGIHQ